MRAPTLPLVLLAMLPLSTAARPVWNSGTFVYADLCTDPQSGLMGRRVVVRRSPNRNDVTYEAASGRLGAALPADALSIDDEHQEIAFTVESGAGPVRFRGTVAPTFLAGTVTDESGERPLQLRRVLRSHAHEDCRAVQREPEATGSTH